MTPTPIAPTHTPPRAFYPLLALFHVFPLHAPITLWILDAPFGKFSVTSALNLPGNLAWCAMELVAPVTFSLHTSFSALTPRARLLAAAYFVHYAHRAVISPLVLSPKRAPLHAVVVAAALSFNWLNARLLSAGLAAFPPPGGLTFYLGLGMWALGFLGNVYHDEILHDLRRPPGKRLVSSSKDTEDKADKSKDGRYSIPRGGLFALVSFPNYLCEWLEWIGFALAASPSVLVAVPALADVLPGWSGAAAWWPTVMLAPGWAFVLAEVTSMLPRALRGHAWYQRTFAAYPKERRAAIPWLL